METLDEIWAAAEAVLGALPRVAVLGTVGDGPEMRVVMLREARGEARGAWQPPEPPAPGGRLPPGSPRGFFGSKDGGALEAVVHTDAATAKVAELKADPRAALLIWDEAAALQLRLTGRARVETGASAADWAAARQENYGKQPAPGMVIAEGGAWELRPAPEAFATVTLDVAALEVLHLGAAHRRARFEAPGWGGAWLVP
ncbi:pyridoxamine 5'-phosphate oxidase family protein [Pseudoroseicyclus sp. CXY001]|uniref:pyridoxamine 5'-phosphate oxidase family protein n=1 Tax=Pseudoroseicyclus sp. CXY001 TaxID=3242492 RepID=UPI00357128D8